MFWINSSTTPPQVGASWGGSMPKKNIFSPPPHINEFLYTPIGTIINFKKMVFAEIYLNWFQGAGSKFADDFGKNSRAHS